MWNKLEPNKFADRMVNTLTTKCMNDNCLWQGDLLDLVQVHQINCGYILQYCMNIGCNEKYLRKDVIHHDKICLYKMIQCNYCQNHVIRMNKENHEVECLNEEVTCIYHKIGCDKKFCRKDIQSHDQTHQANHMKLIYKNLVDCKQENFTMKQENITMKQELISTDNKVTVLTQEIVIMKQENITMKQENVTMKKECFSLRKEVDELKKIFKNENIKLKEKVKNQVVASSEIVDEKQMQVKAVNDIYRLKATLEASPLSEKVLLLNNDKVLKVNYNRNRVECSVFMKNLSECYKNNQFDWIINHYDLGDHSNIMKELLSQLPYHLFDIQTVHRRYITLVFPLDLNNINNLEVTIPNSFKVKIVNNEITVELLGDVKITSILLYIGKYFKRLQHQQKFNIQQINVCDAFEFAPGFACLDIIWKN